MNAASTIANTYGAIAQIESQLERERRWLDAEEKRLTSQIINAENFGAYGRAGYLNEIETLKRLWPEHERLKKSEIFALQGQIESAKNQ